MVSDLEQCTFEAVEEHGRLTKHAEKTKAVFPPWKMTIFPKKCWKKVAPQNAVPSEQIYQGNFEHTSERARRNKRTTGILREFVDFNRLDTAERKLVVGEKQVGTQPAVQQFG